MERSYNNSIINRRLIGVLESIFFLLMTEESFQKKLSNIFF